MSAKLQLLLKMASASLDPSTIFLHNITCFLAIPAPQLQTGNDTEKGWKNAKTWEGLCHLIPSHYGEGYCNWETQMGRAILGSGPAFDFPKASSWTQWEQNAD